MSWASLDPEVREVAERVLTDKQLTALKLWENGAGYRRIGLILNVAMSTARGRVVRAIDTLNRALEEEHGHHAYPVRRQAHTHTPGPKGARAA